MNIIIITNRLEIFKSTCQISVYLVQRLNEKNVQKFFSMSFRDQTTGRTPRAAVISIISTSLFYFLTINFHFIFVFIFLEAGLSLNLSTHLPATPINII